LWLSLGWVIGSAIFGLGLGLKNFYLKSRKFQFFPLRDKKNLFWSGQKVPGSKMGWPLICCGSKVCSGRVRAHLYLIRQKPDFKKYFTSYSMDISSVNFSLEQHHPKDSNGIVKEIRSELLIFQKKLEMLNHFIFFQAFCRTGFQA